MIFSIAETFKQRMVLIEFIKNNADSNTLMRDCLSITGKDIAPIKLIDAANVDTITELRCMLDKHAPNRPQQII